MKWLQILLGSEMRCRYAESFDVFVILCVILPVY